MYSTTHNHVTFFTDSYGKHTEKMFCGRVSEGINTGKKGEDGKDIFEFETHTARFVGAARDKAAALPDKARITLTKWSARSQPYTAKVNGEDKKRRFNYLMVMDFEIREQTPIEPDPAANASDFAMLEDDDAQLPF